jgi:uncharacterized repeat protein (TIGR01451 family)
MKPCASCGGLGAGECICNGGDLPPPVLVSPSWQIYGLNTTDAVAHYDSLDGCTLVEPSNRVCIYAPRFGAVRVVSRIAAGEQVLAAQRAVQPLKPVRHDDVQIANANTQNQQPRGDRLGLLPEEFLARQHEGLTMTQVPLRALQDALLPYENLSIIRIGVMDNSEKARLKQSVDAAIVWSNVQAPQVLLNNLPAQAVIGEERAQLVYEVHSDVHCPKLRIVKVASTPMANPGDTVDFTLRFDNIGDQPLGNIVIVDSLATRLEYVPDSSQASVEAQFSSSPNEDGSLVLRWEITKALMPGEGGIVKFQTRVR